VWEKAIDKVSYTSELVRVQRLINIKIANAYRTVSNEALCMLTGLTPITIKIEKACQLYQLTKGSSKVEAPVDRDMEVGYWHHPAETINFLTENNEETRELS
jgi:peptidyl-tRNA hydrolase